MIDAQPWLDLALHETMILFYYVVHVLTWPSLALFGQQLFLLQVTYGTNVGRILVNVDYPRRRRVRPAQHLDIGGEFDMGISSGRLVE